MRSKSFILVAACLAAMLVLSGGVVAYDRSQDDTIAEGVTIGGVAVGGLDREAAVRRLEERLLPVLREPITIHHATITWTLGPRESRVAADLRSSVEDALGASRDGNLFTRAFRSLTGGKVDKDVRPQVTFSEAAVVRLLDKVRRRVERAPIDAELDLGPHGLKRVAARDGLKVNASELHEGIRAAIVSPAAKRRFVARTRHSRPAVTTEQLADRYDTVVLVDRGAFKLKLYKRLKVVKTYGIAVGQVGLETPAGMYRVQNKAINPAWHVPDSDWAGKLRGKVIPSGDPENPIKARWLGIYDGAGIHGTSAEGSIGSAASHGCIRMRVREVIELYDRVPVGAPVYIA